MNGLAPPGREGGKSPLVDLSIVIVTRDTREMTLEALSSVVPGVGDLAAQVLVVDNGSSDGTAAAVRAPFPAAVVIENAENLGFARAANQGWRRAAAPVALFLNSDARLAPGAAAALCQFLRETPSAGLAGAQLTDPDGRLQNSIDNVPTLATELLNKSLLRRLFPQRFPGKHQVLAAPAAVPTLVGACFAARRETLEALAGFDERFFFFLEETDLCVRARANGWGVFLVPEARAVHRQGRTARKNPVGARIEYYRSRYLFFRKHAGGAAASFLAAGLVVRLVVELLLQGAACAASLFTSERLRARLAATAGIFVWHLEGCPAEAGLSGGAQAAEASRGAA